MNELIKYVCEHLLARQVLDATTLQEPLEIAPVDQLHDRLALDLATVRDSRRGL